MDTATKDTKLHKLLTGQLDNRLLGRMQERIRRVDAMFRDGQALSFGDRGTNLAGDILTDTADGVSINELWTEFIRSLAVWNSERDPLVQMLSYPVTSLTEKVYIPATEEDFEEATEFGVPKGIRVGTTASTMGYGFKWYDIAIRYTWLFLAEAPADQIRALNNEAFEADNRLVFSRVMRRLMNPANDLAFYNDQNVNVFPLYNGDGTVPPRYRTQTFDGSHTHYLTSGGAVIVSQDLDDLEAHLKHHGYTRDRGYDFVLLVNDQEGSIIRQFRVANGDKWDFIPTENVGGGVILTTIQQIIGKPAQNTGPADSRIGTYGPWQVVEMIDVDPGYVVGFVSNGTDRIGNLVGIREHSNTSLRGLRLVKGRDNDYPLIDSFYQHGLGTGVRHRGAGTVMQITANATYSTPAEYV